MKHHPSYQSMKALIFLLLIQLTVQHVSGQTSVKGTDDFRFLEMDITQIGQGYKDGTFTIKEVVQAYLNRIDQIDKNGPELHSIIQVNPDAIAIATALDQ